MDPSHADIYQANAAVLTNSLDALDLEYRSSLATCAQKNIVTSHAAFGYLSKEYGLTQIAIAGLSPDAEPSAKDLAEVTQFVKKNTIGYIFFESLTSPKLSETIAREVGAKTLVLNPVEGLTQEEMTDGKTYFTVMQENLVNLKTALLCK